MPLMESSITKQSFGSRFTPLAAIINTSGSGLDLSVLLPSDIKSKEESKSMPLRIGIEFLLALPRAILILKTKILTMMRNSGYRYHSILLMKTWE